MALLWLQVILYSPWLPAYRHFVLHTPSDLVPETCLLQVIAEIARSEGSTGMAAGQFIDLEGGPNGVDFFQEKKFGEMGQCSVVCDGLLAGASDNEIQRLRKYGQAVGILSVYGVDKAIEVAEDLRSQAKKELDALEKYGDKVLPLYNFVDYTADRGFNV